MLLNAKHLVVSLAACLALTACGSSDPLEGRFTGRGGLIIVTFHAGHYDSPQLGKGVYTVSGGAVSLNPEPAGHVLTGEVLGADIVRLTRADGVLAPTPIELTRTKN